MTHPDPFQLVADEPADDEPDLDANECHCKPADDQYLLTIEEGQAVLRHAGCGKQPGAGWGDFHDLVTMDDPIPVIANWKRSQCDGWHEGIGCDCDYWVQVTSAQRTKLLREVATLLTAQHCSPESLELVRRLETKRLCTDCRGHGRTVTDTPDGGIVHRCRPCNGKGLRPLDSEGVSS